jgi:hypothetical protein
LGRFITPDPYQGSIQLGDPDTWNRYAYVENDPINSTDPHGLMTLTFPSGGWTSGGMWSGLQSFGVWVPWLGKMVQQWVLCSITPWSIGSVDYAELYYNTQIFYTSDPSVTITLHKEPPGWPIPDYFVSWVATKPYTNIPNTITPGGPSGDSQLYATASVPEEGTYVVAWANGRAIFSGMIDPPATGALTLEVLGASPTNVEKHWATPKDAYTTVIVKAHTTPDNQSAWSHISWGGDGAPVNGQDNLRELSCANVNHFHVTARFRGATEYVDVWVMWATLAILTDGPKPENAGTFQWPIQDLTHLGWEIVPLTNDQMGFFKICVVATLEPSGVGSIVSSGWQIGRSRLSHNFKDGYRDYSLNLYGDPLYTDDWADDTTENPDQIRNVPDGTDMIYDEDNPTIAKQRATTAYETYNNFVQYVLWNGMICSANTGWWMAGWWQSGVVTANQGGEGAYPAALPDQSILYPNP